MLQHSEPLSASYSSPSSEQMEYDEEEEQEKGFKICIVEVKGQDLGGQLNETCLCTPMHLMPQWNNHWRGIIEATSSIAGSTIHLEEEVHGVHKHVSFNRPPKSCPSTTTTQSFRTSSSSCSSSYIICSGGEDELEGLISGSQSSTMHVRTPGTFPGQVP